MNRIIQITIIVALVISLAGNIVLTFALSNQTQMANALTMELSKTSKDLSAVKLDLSKSQKDLRTRTAELKQYVDKFQKTNIALDLANTKLRHAMCSTPIPADKVESVSTNQALIDPVTKAADDYYGMNSVNTTFELLWNNTKTAIFTILQKDKTSTKVLVSWSFDTNKVLAITDVGEGCLYYLP
jgi:regulator of replication initiation timing